MANNVLPDPLNVSVVSPDPLRVDIASPLEVTNRGGVGVPVYVQDQITDMLDLYFLQEKTSGLLLATDTVVDTRVITLSTGHGLTTANSKGHILEVASTASSVFYQGEVVSVTGDNVELSPPMSSVFTVAGSVVGTGNPNMCQDDATGVAVDGSVAPVIFKISPLAAQKGDITRVCIATTSQNEADLTTFGGAPALAIGITLRVKRPDGTFKNLFTYEDNFDFALHGYDVANFAPSGNKVTHGLLARVTFAGQSKHGVAVRLDGSLGEELQIIISELMDNSSNGNISVSFMAEGSELQGD